MFKIVRFPSKLNSFFGSLTSEFLYGHADYFQTLVLLMAFSCNRRNILSLYRHLDPDAFYHRTRFNNFLSVSRWDRQRVLLLKAQELLAKLKPKKGDVIRLIIDDTKKAKRGKQMDAVGYIHDETAGKSYRGHQIVAAILSFKGYRIPLGVRLYVKKEDAQNLEIEFQKTTQLAAELISLFDPPKGVSIRVLFDSYYLCPPVVKACEAKGFKFVSTLKKNRNLYKGGRKLKTGKYGCNCFRRKRRKKTQLTKARGKVSYTYIDAGWLQVGKLGMLHVIFSRRVNDKKILGIVTNDRTLSPQKMLAEHGERWAIEVFFKEAKQYLGFGQYQNGSYQAAVTHLHLVCFADALLTHIAIESECAKGKQKRKAKQASRQTTPTMQNELRRIVWEDLTDYLKEQPDGNSVVKELTRLLVAS